MFEELQVEVVMNEAETMALYHMIYNAEGKDGTTEVVSSFPSEKESVAVAVQKLLGSIDEVSAYVDDVVSGRKTGSSAVGLALYDALSTIQSYKQEELSTQLQGKVQDLLIGLPFISHEDAAKDLGEAPRYHLKSSLLTDSLVLLLITVWKEVQI